MVSVATSCPQIKTVSLIIEGPNILHVKYLSRMVERNLVNSIQVDWAKAVLAAPGNYTQGGREVNIY